MGQKFDSSGNPIVTVRGALDNAFSDPTFRVDGVLATATSASRFVVPRGGSLLHVYVVMGNTGSAGSTILDVNLNGSTIFTTQANRPEIAHDDTDGLVVSTTPDVTELSAQDVLTLDIDQVADGASDLHVVVSVQHGITAEGHDHPDYLTETEHAGLSSNLHDPKDHNHSLSEITNSGGLAAKDSVQDGDIDSESSLDGQVLTSDGAGNAAWETPAGSGDMSKSTYDSDDDGVVEEADQVTGQGALATQDMAGPADGGTGQDTSGSTGTPQITGGTWSVLKNNLGASSVPTVNDDSGSGYSVGSRWIDVSADKEYVCLDAGSGAAVWVETTQQLNSVGTIILTAAGGWPSTTNGCADPTKNEYATNGVNMWSLDFDPSSDEYAEWTIAMPDDWDAGTVTATFYWTCASGSAGDTVEWGLQGRALGDDEAIDQGWGTAQTVSDAVLATGDMHKSSETNVITLSGTPAGGELVQFRAYRDTSADNLGNDAMLLMIKVEYGLA